MIKKAIFPGSFSPFTIGHYEIIKRALPLFDKIIIAIGKNNEKNNFFSIDRRKKWIDKIYKNEKKIYVKEYDGLTVEFCKQENAKYIIRGIRDVYDFNYEMRISQTNYDLCEDIETIFFTTPPNISHVSSTLVRDIMKHKGKISKFIPKGFNLYKD